MEKCEAGCMIFTGEEIRHHKDCFFYKDSLSEKYDKMEKEIAELKKQVKDLKTSKSSSPELAKSMSEVKKTAGDIIGMNLITHQTGPEGKIVKKVLVEQGLDIAKELYLRIIPDRATAKIVI